MADPVYRHKAEVEIYKEYGQAAEQPDSEKSFDISALELASSNPSAPPQSTVRLVDFTIHVNDCTAQASSTVVGIVEGKLFPTELGPKDKTAREIVAQEMRDMLPQVVQQAQFVFHQHSDLKDLVAFLFVNSFCRTLRFKRDRVPELDLDDIPPDGFAFPEGSRRLIEYIPEKPTRLELYPVMDKTGNYDKRFKAVFNRLVELARKV